MNSAAVAKLRCCCKPGQPGGCWFLAQACCPEKDGRTLAYPCTEPNLFDVETDPPPPVTFVYQGNCFNLFPTPYNTHQAGWTDITAADIEQVVPDCTDPACGDPCVRYYQPLLPCCTGGAEIGIAYGDCDPQYWFGQAGVVSFKIGSQCYIPDPETVGGLCTGFANPPPTYIGPGPYSFQTYPSCAACCAISQPVGCPDDCIECSSTYTVQVPTFTCFVPDLDCNEPSPPLCLCPVGDCTYNHSAMALPISKPQGLLHSCFWSGTKTTPNGMIQSGCCVPDAFGHAGTQVVDLEYAATLGCSDGGIGDPQWVLTLGGSLVSAIYHRQLPPSVGGCPVGTYFKVSEDSPCHAPDTVEVTG